jgi:hypothetical protein
VIERLLPEAFVDALAVVGFLSGESVFDTPPPKRRPVGDGEIHLFAYLACLLSLYRLQPTAAWGYVFVRTDSGLPFSDSIALAAKALAPGGLVEVSSDEGYLITARGRAALHQFGTLGLMRERVEFIQAACDAAITIPPTTIRRALSAEPGLTMAANRSLYTSLGSEGAREALYEQFKILHRVLGFDVASLLIPAMAWLTYLSEPAGSSQNLPLDPANA